jgi:hypothetical protein
MSLQQSRCSCCGGCTGSGILTQVQHSCGRHGQLSNKLCRLLLVLLRIPLHSALDSKPVCHCCLQARTVTRQALAATLHQVLLRVPAQAAALLHRTPALSA